MEFIIPILWGGWKSLILTKVFLFITTLLLLGGVIFYFFKGAYVLCLLILVLFLMLEPLSYEPVKPFECEKYIIDSSILIKKKWILNEFLKK